MIEFIDKTSEQNGTPINRENMMGIQGFLEYVIDTSNGFIKITSDNSETIMRPFNINGETSVTLTGERTITKTTYLKPNGIQGVLNT